MKNERTHFICDCCGYDPDSPDELTNIGKGILLCDGCLEDHEQAEQEGWED